jgi:uncharacterized protein (DUF736 family)
MPQIGTFTKTKTGFSGRVRTLALDAELTIRPAEKSDAENAPDYRIFAAGPRSRRCLEPQRREAGDYLSTSIDDPTLTQPLRAACSSPRPMPRSGT